MIPLIITIVIGFWLFSNIARSILNGWFEFRKANPPSTDIIESRFSWISIKFKMPSFKAFSIKIGQRGLHISPNIITNPIIWPGFAFIPWKDIVYNGPACFFKDLGESNWLQFEQISTGKSFALCDIPAIVIRDIIFEQRSKQDMSTA